MSRQIFAGKPDSTFYNIWDLLIIFLICMKMFRLWEPNSQDADWPNGMTVFQFNGKLKQIMEQDISN